MLVYLNVFILFCSIFKDHFLSQLSLLLLIFLSPSSDLFSISCHLNHVNTLYIIFKIFIHNLSIVFNYSKFCYRRTSNYDICFVTCEFHFKSLPNVWITVTIPKINSLLLFKLFMQLATTLTTICSSNFNSLLSLPKWSINSLVIINTICLWLIINQHIN